jgi:hypothetical protein
LGGLILKKILCLIDLEKSSERTDLKEDSEFSWVIEGIFQALTAMKDRKA